MRRRRVAGGTVWRVLVPVVAVGAGLLLATTAVTAGGTDLRSSRALQLSELVAQQQRDLDRLADRERALRHQVNQITAQAGERDGRVAAARRQGDALAGPSGLTPVQGPGVTVALDDAPRPPAGRTLPGNPSPDDLVVHQQDVQGVVNALWSGGAEAMTLMGQRVVSTTAVRCVGNTLLLHGRVYSPPFRVSAIGDPARLKRALDAAPDVQVFRQYVAAYGLGFAVSTHARLTMPAFDGPLDLPHSQVPR